MVRATQDFGPGVAVPDKIQDACNIWDIVVPKNSSLLLGNANVIGHLVFLLAKLAALLLNAFCTWFV